MKSVRVLSLATATLVLAALAAGIAIAANAVAPKTIAFKGSYVGTVTEKVDGQTVTAHASGTGSGTLVGKSKLFGTAAGTTAEPPCSPLSGPGTITGPAGKLRLTLLPTSRACAASADDQTNITVSGNAKVTGGTLKLRKAKGTLHFSGHYDRGSGAFNVTLTGRLTY